MGQVDSIVNQEGPLMADPCSDEQMTSNNEKIDDVGMNNWLELQEKAKLHDSQRPTKVCPSGDRHRQMGSTEDGT
jgi:hypothetical protein